MPPFVGTAGSPTFDGIKKEKNKPNQTQKRKKRKKPNIKEKTPDVEIHIIHKPKLPFSSDLSQKKGSFKTPQR